LYTWGAEESLLPCRSQKLEAKILKAHLPTNRIPQIIISSNNMA
jgi:hypothetical protein